MSASYEAFARRLDPPKPAPGPVVETLSQFLARELPPPTPIFAPFLNLGENSLWYAPRGAGKTWLTLSAGYCAAAGMGLLGWKCPGPVKTLLVDGEMPGASLQQRLAVLAASFDQQPEDGYFSIMAAASQPRILDLARASDRELMDEAARGYQLLILDNISALVRSGEENSGDYWAPVADWASRHRAEGRTVVWVHHSGKSGDQRGSSRREDIMDSVVRLRPLEGTHGEKTGAQFLVEYTKHRHFYGADADPFEAELVNDPVTGLVHWVRREAEQSTEDRVLAMWDDGLRNLGEIAEAIGRDKSNVSRALKRLRLAGRIE